MEKKLKMLISITFSLTFLNTDSLMRKTLMDGTHCGILSSTHGSLRGARAYAG
jgi:hypothetical protein